MSQWDSWRSRLRRTIADRPLVRVGAVYLAVAVVVVLVADQAAAAGILPLRTTLILLPTALFAFPVVLAAVWILDSPPDDAGISSGGQEDRPGSAGAFRRSRQLPRRSGTAPGTEATWGTLVVLPFQVRDGGPDVLAVADGLHAELATALGKLPGLPVIGRRSASFYRDSGLSTAGIARELDAEMVVEGAVSVAGGRIRVAVQLFDAARDGYRWAERYDRILSPGGLFEIRMELVRRVADSLHQDLSMEMRLTQSGSERPETQDMEAYRACSIGRGLLDRRTRESLTEALGAFRSAVERDPDYARAWAGLAEATAVLRWRSLPTPREAPDPDDAAHRAVELDPALGEAPATLGVVHMLRGDGPTALASLTRAREIDPGLADVRAWLTWLHLMLGDAETAVEEARRGVRLDPHSPGMRIAAAAAFLALGRYRAGRDHARRAVELDPGRSLSHYMEGLASYHLEELPEARDALDRAASLVDAGGDGLRESGIRALAGLIHVGAGERLEAAALLKSLGQEVGTSGRVGGEAPADLFAIGVLHLGMGDTDLAIDLFRRVGVWGPLTTVQIRYMYPDLLGPVRGDERFQRLMEEVDRSWIPAGA